MVKPWCTGKQLPPGFILTGHFRMILKIILKKKELSRKLQAASFKLQASSALIKTQLNDSRIIKEKL